MVEQAELVALSGLGRMGGALAERLRTCSYRLRVFDSSDLVRDRHRAAGFDVADTLAGAASGADVVLLCLPDAAAVEVSVDEILRASPPPTLVIDLTSSLPAVTRRAGSRLAAKGIAMIDAPVSGGVAGARAGSLTAMVGGDQALIQRARRWLDPFASKVMPAGPLASGHTVKALNNALSAAALTVTSEMLVTGVAHGIDPVLMVDAFNGSDARTQNSEVKFVQQILPRTFAAGFTAGLMLKDVDIACSMADDSDAFIPFTRVLRERWSAFSAEFGPTVDFTRIHESVEAWSSLSKLTPSRRTSSLARPLAQVELSETLARATFVTCAVATCELMNLASKLRMDISRVLTIVNEGSGRNEATRRYYPRTLDGLPWGLLLRDAEGALARAAGHAEARGVSALTVVVALQIVRLARQTHGAGSDFSVLVADYSAWSAERA